MSTASKVAEHKAKHPELYCPTKRCLWHTGGGHCPRHAPKAEVVWSQGSITGDPYPVLRIRTGRQSQGRDYITLQMTCSSYEEDRVAACKDLESIAEAING